MSELGARVATIAATDVVEEASVDLVVERVVAQLNVLCRKATLAFALSVGRLIVHEFYGGDVMRLRSRDPRKEISLRKLASHPDLPMTRDALCRSVAMYELSERLDVRSWRHISTSHLRLVLPLPPQEQERLLRAVEANRWTVRQLDEHVALVRPPAKAVRRGGPKRRSALKNKLLAVERCLASLDALEEDTEASPESARCLIDILDRAAVAVTKWQHRMQALNGSIE